MLSTTFYFKIGAPNEWYPLIDGKRPEFLDSRKACQSPAYQVYSNLANAASAAVKELEGSIQSNQLPKSAYKDDCLISIGLRNDPHFSGDFEGMSNFASSVGLKSRVDYKFYDFANDLVWPGSSTNYYTPVYGAVYASILKCVLGGSVIASCACPAGTSGANSNYTLNGITYRQCVCN